jgi:hypothetical protein
VISEEQRAEIKRLYVVEKWRQGTIAAQLGLHRQTVAKALKTDRVGQQTEKKSILDPYLPIISEILTKYPSLSGSRIHQMIL